MENKKTEKQKEQKLNWFQKAELFYRNLFMLPSRDGGRRWAKNIWTGKHAQRKMLLLLLKR